MWVAGYLTWICNSLQLRVNILENRLVGTLSQMLLYYVIYQSIHELECAQTHHIPILFNSDTIGKILLNRRAVEHSFSTYRLCHCSDSQAFCSSHSLTHRIEQLFTRAVWKLCKDVYPMPFHSKYCDYKTYEMLLAIYFLTHSITGYVTNPNNITEIPMECGIMPLDLVLLCVCVCVKQSSQL